MGYVEHAYHHYVLVLAVVGIRKGWYFQTLLGGPQQGRSDDAVVLAPPD